MRVQISKDSQPYEGKFFSTFIMDSAKAYHGDITICARRWFGVLHDGASSDCSQRCAFGFAEVKLGLIPVNRYHEPAALVGVEQALSIAATGQPISAQSALAMGLIDAIADDNGLLLTFTKKCLAGAKQEWIVHCSYILSCHLPVPRKSDLVF